MDCFRSLSIILPVINETDSLVTTIETILRDCDADVKEIVVVVCEKTTTQSLDICRQFQEKLGERFVLIFQTLPYLGGAMRDAFAKVRGSHAIMMASDLETPPENVKDFIAVAKKHSDAIITGSRWITGGGFSGYSKMKYVLNYIFQRIFAFLYWVKLTDMTYGYRIFPVELLQSIKWEELRHAFLFETLLKPLKLGIKVIEIPVTWRMRVEGSSQNTFMQNFIYFRIGLKTLGYSKKRILKSGINGL